MRTSLAKAEVPASQPAYASISVWTQISGVGRTTTYTLLASGDLRAVKAGARTLIDIQHGLAWLKSLPAAKIAAPNKNRNTN